MAIKKPYSKENPGNQSVKTPYGKEIPKALSMMVDSMVRMIQKGNDKIIDLDSKEP